MRKSKHDKMENSDNLARNAYEQLDEGQYSEAISNFRQSMRLRSPSSRLLVALNHAERMDMVTSRQKLAELYPENTDLQLDYAQILFQNGFADLAVRIYTNILASNTLSIKEESVIRLRRFRATCRSANEEHFAEDFWEIWENDGTFTERRSFKKALLEAIFDEIVTIKKCQILRTILKDNRLADDVNMLLEQHIEAIQAIDQI